VSSRNKRGHEFFSAKNTFVVGSIEIVNRDYLTITIFDAHNASHSIEILNPPLCASTTTRWERVLPCLLE